MKKYTAVPNNYVQRNNGETVREGDIYVNFRGEIGKCVHSVGHVIGEDDTSNDYSDFKFYRRLRNKQSDTVRISATPTYGYENPRQSEGRATRKPAKVKVVDITTEKAKVPIVSFIYGNFHRNVQVISFDDEYLKGLERKWRHGKYVYQFKTYRRGDIQGNIKLDSYVPAE